MKTNHLSRAELLQKTRLREFERALEIIGSSIRNPVVKLQFLRESLAQYESLRRRVDWIPLAVIRRAAYRWLSLERFRSYADARTLSPYHRAHLRRALWLGRFWSGLASSLILCGITASSIAILVMIPSLSARMTSQPSDALARESAPARSLRLDPPAATPRCSPPPSVWLVERGKDWEQYSNGLRIDTRYSVPGDPRRFHVFDDTGRLEEIHHAPVGILYHTSESDIWPLEASFNERLRDSSDRLIRYIRRRRLYNYVIDRFGRSFRVVEEHCKANHSGHSIWGHNGRYYLNLNHPFIGICFESRWEGGVSLPITTAQITTARSLTDCLRFRYGIAPEMCAGHGMASVNPTRHLIGHHLDWARGLPFDALGLPDQYRRPPPSIAVFGFDYDDHFLNEVVEPWPGIRTAERFLAAEAARRGISLTALRMEKQARYDEWLSQHVPNDNQPPHSTRRAARGGS
ncbi:MAG: N-acetylmuramoyl-L-alanine amidase [Vicinamibacteria bacterium]|nr:N-acetylmuramoyl-L-alanine amidase [Vicinamibacteria bacterium]